MFAMTIAPGGALRRTEVPDPVPQPGEAVIDVHAAAVNRADLMQRAGTYPSPPGWPAWPGLEVAGTVASAPPGSRFRPGDRVCALLGGGGYAEKVAVPAGMMLPVPSGLTMVQAAGIPEVFATAYLNLFLEARLTPGETVFVQAGASGLGIAAIQLAHRAGARVVTTVGGEAKARFVRELGADAVIDHRAENVVDALRQNPPDVALDCVGGPELGAEMAAMNPWGRWILLAALGGNRAELPLDTIFRNRLRLIGSTLRSRTDEMKARILGELESRYFPAFTSGELRSVIFAEFPLDEAMAAHAVLENRANIGKVVLKIRD